MKRTIKIPALNDGEEFEVPERKPKHRIAFYKKMVELKKENPDLWDDRQYRDTMESAYLALYVVQERYPDTTIDNLLGMSDDNEKNSLFHLSCIVYGSDYEVIMKKLKDKDFQKPLPKLEKGKKN